MRDLPITPELLLAAYANGYFPMAQSQESAELHWFNPEMRAIFPLDEFHIPASLAKFMRKHPFELRIDSDFPSVINACAQARDKRPETWINPEIIALYTRLWTLGFAHSVECWEHDKLVGGLYGVSIAGAFFGESMFSHVPDASKVALVKLVSLLNQHGFMLLDAQFTNPHLLQFGLIEIPREDYLKRLRLALETPANFNSPSPRSLQGL